MSYDKHIVLFSPGFPAHEEDWYCIPPLQAFVQALHAARPTWKISIIALHYPYKAQVYKWKGLTVHALGGNNNGFPNRLLLWRKASQLLKKLHHEQPVDWVHTFWIQECTYLAQKFCKRFGIPQIATIMGQDAHLSDRYIRRIDFSRIKVVAISDRAAEAFAKANRTKATRVIPWGADALIADLAGAVQAAPIPHPDKSIDLIGVGNLVAVKQYGLFIEVLAKIAQSQPAVKAVIVGGGAELSQLQERASAVLPAGMLSFAGHLDRPQILELLQKSRVFLHTAASEGQGYVFSEALAAGLPIVSTPVGIAHPTAQWAVGDTADSLSAACLDFLAAKSNFAPRVFPTLSSTLNAYLEIYQA